MSDFPGPETPGGSTDPHEHSDVIDGGASLSPEDLDIGNSDLVASGDFLSLFTMTPHTRRTLDFTATSYANDNGLSSAQIQWDQMIPAGAQGAILAESFIVVGTDETVSVRIQDAQQGETVVEKTGISSSQFVTLGPVDYTPPDPSARSFIRFEWMTDNGTNTSTMDGPWHSIGVQL